MSDKLGVSASGVSDEVGAAVVELPDVTPTRPAGDASMYSFNGSVMVPPGCNEAPAGSETVGWPISFSCKINC